MKAFSALLARLKLRYLLFLLLLLAGIVPLAISSALLTRQNREILETQEKSHLTRSAEALSLELNDYLVSLKKQLHLLGASLRAVPQPAQLEGRLRAPWVTSYLQDFMVTHPNLLALRVLDAEGSGPRFAPPDLAAPAALALDEAYEQARESGAVVYRFEVLPETNEPVVVVTVPVAEEGQEPVLFVETVARLHLMETVFEREAQGEVAVFLVDRSGLLLWSEGASDVMERAVRASDLVRDFVRYPLNLTAEYSLMVEGKRRQMIGRVSPVEETGWGVLVHKPAAAAFVAVERMIFNTVLSTALLILLALVIAGLAAGSVSQPIQRLAQTSHEIAAGNFGQRVRPSGLVAEIHDLAEDFNRMSGHVQSYVEQLQQAAQTNRALFIGSIRAFAAAIDAKDPYTRGHSERVAAYSRTIARHLGQSEEQLHRIWVAALLHDVGKIGVDDRILKKGGILTAEEYEQMKLHPVIGADILSPIEQLKEMIPAVRWHHEAWNGKGYPEKLKGEECPLMARIVAVADCFDAITTNRPYQRAYTYEFAVETITKLTGTRFDAKVVTAFLRAFDAGEIRVERVAAEAEAGMAQARAVGQA
jgi:HD-GYP domain-containing protein (c-di-GMP phosphodiesterase class II)